MPELKPCPFCGEKALLQHGIDGVTTTSFVKCTNYKCGIIGKKFSISSAYSSDEKAVEAWNRRAGDA